MASFLWAINQLVTGEVPCGFTSLVYVSPLKALNNDIQRNLLTPLEQLRTVFGERDEVFPDIRVLTRSGDTPQSDRRRMLREPPEILITTPESLNLMLSSKGGCSILNGVKSVLLDEVHGVFDSKRGVHLMTAVERLTRLSGEFQRIALSATIRPMETVGAFVGGYELNGSMEAPVYTPRIVERIASNAEKRYDLRIVSHEEAFDPTDPNAVWGPVVEDCKARIKVNRSTLIFANSRRLVETLTLKINEGERKPVAYSHHGSLSREIRAEVESRLKSGDLKAIVATNSLEMGIDIGALDEVILVQSPRAVSSAVQRVGRAGHQVGEVSRGVFYPTHAQDFLESAVLARGILDGDIEAAHPVKNPLDVLSQILVSMVCMETWHLDALYAFVRTCWSFQEIRRTQFDLVVRMLAGRYADSRVRELQPRVSVDGLENTITGRKGSLQVLYRSGGTIPDRGYFHMRHIQGNARIGELDEEFVWEANVGKTFALGTQHWRIEQITHSDVFVSPAGGASRDLPFWKAEGYSRDFHFSERIGLFLEDADTRVEDPAFEASLQSDYRLDDASASRLVTFLSDQKSRTRASLPHRHHLLLETAESGPRGAPGNQIVLHTMWGGRVNVPLALAMEAAWEDRYGQSLEVFPSNEGIVLMAPHDVDAEAVLSLVNSSNLESFIRQRLESSGFFGARFRECAGRALVLTKMRAGERMPLWLSRLKSQKLLAAVGQYDDFPILLETWRACLQDEFDLENTGRVLSELDSGEIEWSFAQTTYPSPMAQTGAWRQVNQYMYMDDAPKGGVSSNLRRDLIRDAVLIPELRPSIDPELARRFEQKRQRLWPGYAPNSDIDLVDWVKERIVVPIDEWDALVEAIKCDHGDEASDVIDGASSRLARLTLGEYTSVLALERVDEICLAWYGGSAVSVVRLSDGQPIEVRPQKDGTGEEGEEIVDRLLGEWLSFYGPSDPEAICDRTGVGSEMLASAIDDLVESERVIRGVLLNAGTLELVCDAENFEILIRLSRSDAESSFVALPIEELAPFLARYQGLVEPVEGVEGVYQAVERLSGYRASASLWESEFLPARVSDYEGGDLDSLMQEGGARWVGTEGEQVSIHLSPDYDLLFDEGREPRATEEGLDTLFPDPTARYDFMALLKRTGMSAPALSSRLWKGVWSSSLVNDSFGALRRGIETRFTVPEAVPDRARATGWSRRAAFSAWRGQVLPGNWMPAPVVEPPDGLVDREERNKDRVRMVLDRYGVVFRELLARETPPFRWGVLFRSLRLMELSGEVVAGYFFEGISGPQFASQQALRMLRRAGDGEPVYWMSAADPASVCGLPIDALRGSYPRRLPGNHLVFRGSRCVMTSMRSGKELTIDLDPADPALPSCLGLLRHLMTRHFRPIRSITVEKINGRDAGSSPYVDVLKTVFDARVDFRSVILHRNI